MLFTIIFNFTFCIFNCFNLPPARFELTTTGLGNRCSIHLSYGGMLQD